MSSNVLPFRHTGPPRGEAPILLPRAAQHAVLRDLNRARELIDDSLSNEGHAALAALLVAQNLIDRAAGTLMDGR